MKQGCLSTLEKLVTETLPRHGESDKTVAELKGLLHFLTPDKQYTYLVYHGNEPAYFHLATVALAYGCTESFKILIKHDPSVLLSKHDQFYNEVTTPLELATTLFNQWELTPLEIKMIKRMTGHQEQKGQDIKYKKI